MFSLDMPNMPPSPAIVIAASAEAQKARPTERVLGICLPIAYVAPGSEPNVLAGAMIGNPSSSAAYYLSVYEKLEVKTLPPLSSFEIVKAPTHTKLVLGKNGAGEDAMFFVANPGYVGRDYVELRVNIEGRIVKLAYYIHVTKADLNTPGAAPRFCPKEPYWKISTSESSLLDWQRSASLSALLADASQSFAGFQNLDGSSVGQTTGEGTSAQITLETTAAGHGWYVDATPLDNSDDYLPTTNPNEWIAKADSEAAGKMDMLSVLLHEYGHALGIEHSADSGDYMATTLQPGVRRLPSTEELALMAQLVGEIKSGSNGAPDTPQSPSLPVGTTLSALLVGRLRRTAYGSWSPVFDSVQIPAPAVRFEIAANPTLTDPKLQTGTGWETTGSVSIGNGAAILTETATSQTRLNQVFIVGEHDRYLSFTVAGIGLDDQANGPDDAFEVGLLDANSGASLAGTIGLTHSDALLNLQADSSEFVGQGSPAPATPTAAAPEERIGATFA